MSTQLRTYFPAVALMLTAMLPAAALGRAQRSAVSQAYQLTDTAKYDPSLSPDGKRMVYITVVEGREQLFTMNADGTGSAQLTRDDADYEDPAWSPDGKSIAFVYMKDGLEIISLMNADGSN